MEIWGEHCVQVYGKFTRRGRAHVYSCISTVTYLQLESAVKCKCDVCAITGQCENKGWRGGEWFRWENLPAIILWVPVGQHYQAGPSPAQIWCALMFERRQGKKDAQKLDLKLPAAAGWKCRHEGASANCPRCSGSLRWELSPRIHLQGTDREKRELAPPWLSSARDVGKDRVGKSQALHLRPGCCATSAGRGGFGHPREAPSCLLEQPGCSRGLCGTLLPRMSEAVENGAQLRDEFRFRWFSVLKIAKSPLLSIKWEQSTAISIAGRLLERQLIEKPECGGWTCAEEGWGSLEWRKGSLTAWRGVSLCCSSSSLVPAEVRSL